METLTSLIQTFSEMTGLKVWALTVFAVVLIALLLDFAQRSLMRRLEVWVVRTENLWDDALFHAAGKPISLVIWVMGITLATQLIPGRYEGDLLSDRFIILIQQLGVLTALTWLLLRLVLNIEANIVRRADKQDREIDRTTVQALGRVVRVAIVVTSILIGLDTLGFNIAGLMAAGGIGGLAIGFAAKDMLANLFGGLTVFIDRPFGVGDWILLKQDGIEGVVENIGWRQTTIRKFDKRPIYVPNAIFTTASVENPSRMTNRRINETFGLRLRDLDKMERITAAVKEMLSRHPEIDEQQTLMVNFDAVAPSSLNFFIYCMTHTTVWTRFHEVKQDVLLRIGEIISDHGAELAVPARSVQVDPLQGDVRLTESVVSPEQNKPA